MKFFFLNWFSYKFNFNVKPRCFYITMLFLSFVGVFWSCLHMKLSCDQQISQTSAISAYLHVLLLHLCPVCALKAMFPALHTPVMDGMKCITAPRGALHQYNSPELTSSSVLQQCSISHTVTKMWVQRGLMENEGRNGWETQMLLHLKKMLVTLKMMEIFIFIFLLCCIWYRYWSVTKLWCVSVTRLAFIFCNYLYPTVCITFKPAKISWTSDLGNTWPYSHGESLFVYRHSVPHSYTFFSSALYPLTRSFWQVQLNFELMSL